MNKFAQLLNDNDIPYEEIKTNYALAKYAKKIKQIDLRQKLDNAIFSIIAIILLFFIVGLFISTKHVDACIMTLYKVQGIISIISLLVILSVIKNKIKENDAQYDNRRYYLIKCEEDTTEETIKALHEKIAQKRYRPNGEKIEPYLYSSIYNLILKQEHLRSTVLSTEYTKENLLIIIVLEGDNLYDSPILIAPKCCIDSYNEHHKVSHF